LGSSLFSAPADEGAGFAYCLSALAHQFAGRFGSAHLEVPLRLVYEDELFLSIHFGCACSSPLHHKTVQQDEDMMGRGKAGPPWKEVVSECAVNRAESANVRVLLPELREG
jgi:hypothetical protein